MARMAGRAEEAWLSYRNCSVIPQHLLEYLLDRVGRYSKLSKSGHPWGGHVVDLHQFHFIPSDRRAREHFREPSQGMPRGKWHRDQYRLEPGLLCNGSEQFLVAINMGAPTFERHRMRLRPFQRPRDS